MAAVSLLMIGSAIAHFTSGDSANAPTLSLNDPRFVLFSVLALIMVYYIYVGVSRYLNRTPQVMIDHEGIALGFGRNARIAWEDIQWVRLRRLAMRTQLQIGVEPQAFLAADLRLSQFNLDDSLRPVRGMPATVMVRDNGLDTNAVAMLDAVKSFRPNLVRS
ncbi:MAG: hypothetical protein EPO41_29360 [Reyranella sp.]|uniref:hypothetical protein n=1 Tax=Reyranella sp. TaxID=1929291 RepID=UPI001222511A|nr:hypothetical protein [Reyranella sp.]TAJ84201.1 MAG: hypothetical protein EPO41_29360 [Reyranella sp.]